MALFGGGAILAGLMLGAIAAFIIDRSFDRAALLIGKTNLDQFATGLVAHAARTACHAMSSMPPTCRADHPPDRPVRSLPASSASRWAPTLPDPAAFRPPSATS